MTDHLDHLDQIARKHRVSPLARAHDAMMEAYRLGMQDARAPRELSRPGRRRYGATPEESAVLERVLTARAAGETWQSIADRLTADGITQRNGRPWTTGALHSIAMAR